LNLGGGKLVAACIDNNIRALDKDKKTKKINAHDELITALIVLKEREVLLLVLKINLLRFGKRISYLRP
jgi:hypothetical protein